MHERLAERAGKPADSCVASPETIDLTVPFEYAETALSPEGREALGQMATWLRCHPQATLALAVANEQHYRRPAQEQALREGRLSTVTAWLREAGVADARVHRVSDKEDPATNPADAARLTLRGRGW